LYPATTEVLPVQLNVAECAAVDVAVKFTLPTFALLTVTFWLAGVKVYPLLLGVTV
jgi:hypothetical protein